MGGNGLSCATDESDLVFDFLEGMGGVTEVVIAEGGGEKRKSF